MGLRQGRFHHRVWVGYVRILPRIGVNIHASGHPAEAPPISATIAPMAARQQLWVTTQRQLGAGVLAAVCRCLLLTTLLAVCGCAGEAAEADGADGAVWNNPYAPGDDGQRIFYTSFDTRPKHLDPVQSYSENEASLLFQIYEPPLQYHYLKRPYTLMPAAARELPQVSYYDARGRPLGPEAAAEAVAMSVYEIRIAAGIRYQPHPAFALDAQGQPVYAQLTRADLRDKNRLSDFALTGTRELSAADYVYQIKRLAHPRLHSPILELMSDYIIGLRELSVRLRQADADKSKSAWLDVGAYPLAGVELVDRYTYRIRIKGKYPQFAQWLAMTFFVPVPVEVERFYAQPGMAEKNLTLDWYPVGTGPYMLTDNNPNARMVLERNPNYRGETYPCSGEPEDAQAGLLKDCGKRLPFIDKIVFVREREAIPYWNKFLQGYYDASGVASDNFDQAVQMVSQADVTVSDAMRERGIRLQTAVTPTNRYAGFNMLDPVVGGSSERARKLRLAISIAIDEEEHISIFLNGRGVPAMGPVPPGLFGYRDGRTGINPYVYDWVDGQARRKSVDAAKQLLAEAGYPNGRDASSGEPLVIHLDTTAGGVGDKAQIDWLQKQLAKIDLQLVVRSTDYNRFQDKMRLGTAQLFYWGWNADYPDPENFLFLFQSQQAKAKTMGENAANYANPQYDALYERMKGMADGPERQAVIDRMVDLLRHDAPWIFGYFDKEYALFHSWVGNEKPGKIIRSRFKYLDIDTSLRQKLRRQWNRPVFWPLLGLLLLGLLLVLPALAYYRRRERRTGIG